MSWPGVAEWCNPHRITGLTAGEDVPSNRGHSLHVVGPSTVLTLTWAGNASANSFTWQANGVTLRDVESYELLFLGKFATVASTYPTQLPWTEWSPTPIYNLLCSQLAGETTTLLGPYAKGIVGSAQLTGTQLGWQILDGKRRHLNGKSEISNLTFQVTDVAGNVDVPAIGETVNIVLAFYTRNGKQSC